MSEKISQNSALLTLGGAVEQKPEGGGGVVPLVLLPPRLSSGLPFPSASFLGKVRPQHSRAAPTRKAEHPHRPATQEKPTVHVLPSTATQSTPLLLFRSSLCPVQNSNASPLRRAALHGRGAARPRLPSLRYWFVAAARQRHRPGAHHYSTSGRAGRLRLPLVRSLCLIRMTLLH